MQATKRSLPVLPLVHQPALDGLRGVAVVMVMLYHHHGRFAVGVFRGGYLGVDIFFVLSGFLITWLLLHEWSTSGSIHFVAFWGRRARRLVPALLAMLVVVAVLDRFVYPTSLQPVIRADVPWVLGYLENWHLASASGATSSPLSHSWSLAVEEQWYLLWPVALMILLRLTRNRPRRLLGTVVSLAAVGAVGTAVAFNGSDGYRVFFGTDARAQELLVGSALAVWCATMASPRSRLPGPLLDRAGLLALLMLGAYAVAGPSSLPALRGGYLVAALVTALVILSAMVPGSWAGSLLARRELVAVGRVSYGLYLFHFPIYRWLNPPATGLDGWPLFVLRFAVTAVVALASFVWIEQPIRRGRRRGVPLVVLGAAVGVGVLSVTSVGVAAVIPPPRSKFLSFMLGTAAAASPTGTTRILVVGSEEAINLATRTGGLYRTAKFEGSAVGVAGCGFTSISRKCADTTGDVAALAKAYRAHSVALVPSALDQRALAGTRTGRSMISRLDRAIEGVARTRVVLVVSGCPAAGRGVQFEADRRLRRWAQHGHIRTVELPHPPCDGSQLDALVRWPALVKALR